AGHCAAAGVPGCVLPGDEGHYAGRRAAASRHAFALGPRPQRKLIARHFDPETAMSRLRIRTFIALALDAPVRRRVRELQTEFAEADADIKWTEPDNLHLTMLFLGEVDGVDLVDVCKAVRGVADGRESFSLEIAGVGCFPNVRR